MLLVRIWILLSTVLCAAGWLLSAVHELNRTGYAIVLALTGGIGLWWWQRQPEASQMNGWQKLHRLSRRFRRPAPLLFLSLILLALLSGALYPPFTSDALMYRTPRVLHWAQEEHWHWIRTLDSRLNTRGCGFEWLTMPLLLFTKTDRLFFLINLISYVLLPGLVFSVFRQLRVQGRVAWWWMWLLPAGWCYTLSAGSLNNDSFASIYALAAINFALRGLKSRQIVDLWLSALAMALLTGVKQTLVPLALLWLIAAAPSFRLLLTRPFATALIIVLCLLVSALPTIYFDLSHDANWAGSPKHPDPGDFFGRLGELDSPWWGMAGNMFCLAMQNFSPPFNPFYKNWNEAMHKFLQTPLGGHFASFEDFCHLPAFLTEQSAGLGIIVGFLLLVSISSVWRWRMRHATPILMPAANLQIRLLHIVPWVLLLLFMAKVGAIEDARMLSPYYPFLLPAVLMQTGQQSLVRRHWWQNLGLLTLISAMILLVLLPARPLLPVNTILALWQQHHPESEGIAKLTSFYSGLGINLVQRQAFEKSLPATEHCIGYATDCQGLEPSLWLPFTRRVERVLPSDTGEELRRRNIHYVVVDPTFLGLTHCTIDELLTRYNARLVDQLITSSGFRKSPNHIYLIQLRDETITEKARTENRGILGRQTRDQDFDKLN
jgi:hypothetical protein